jgi:hypothetical protein
MLNFAYLVLLFSFVACAMSILSARAVSVVPATPLDPERGA